MGSEPRLSDIAEPDAPGSALRALPRVSTMPEAWYHPGAMGGTSLTFASRIGLSQVSRWSLQLARPGIEGGQTVRPPIDYWPWASPVSDDAPAPVVHRGLPRTLIRRGGVNGPGAFVANLRPEIVDPGDIGAGRSDASQSSASQANNSMAAFKRMLERTGRIEADPTAGESEHPAGSNGDGVRSTEGGRAPDGARTPGSTPQATTIGPGRSTECVAGLDRRPRSTVRQARNTERHHRPTIAGFATAWRRLDVRTASSTPTNHGTGQEWSSHGQSALTLAAERGMRPPPTEPNPIGNGRTMRERSSAGLLDTRSSPVVSTPTIGGAGRRVSRSSAIRSHGQSTDGEHIGGQYIGGQSLSGQSLSG